MQTRCLQSATRDPVHASYQTQRVGDSSLLAHSRTPSYTAPADLSAARRVACDRCSSLADSRAHGLTIPLAPGSKGSIVACAGFALSRSSLSFASLFHFFATESTGVDGTSWSTLTAPTRPRLRSATVALATKVHQEPADTTLPIASPQAATTTPNGLPWPLPSEMDDRQLDS